MKKKLVLLCLYCVFFNCIFPVLLHAQTAKINPFVLRINKLINQKLKENALTKDIRNKLFFNSDGKNIPEDSNPEFVINPCEQTISINNGQTIAGSLASTDCQIADGSYIDFYSFSALAGDRVTISMNSSLFDTFLYLQNQGDILAYDDDSGEGSNSLIQMVLPYPGVYIIGANSFNPSTFGNYTVNLIKTSTVIKTKFDFDGDGKADASIFRPSDGTWHLQQSQAGYAAAQFGISTDILVPADYDGDGKTDIAVFRAGYWYLLRSTEGFAAAFFGQSGDIPQPADFTGDGRAELAVFRPSDNNWYTLNLVNNQFQAVQFGSTNDKPAAGDYDGDGRSDYAVYRPNNGTWYLLQSTAGFAAAQFGVSSDKTVPADYDGDGKTDIAVYRDGTWYLLQSTQGFAAIQFGISTDKPVAADYDGDGKADFAVYRSGMWYLLQSSNGFASVSFGLADDLAIPNSYVR